MNTRITLLALISAVLVGCGGSQSPAPGSGAANTSPTESAAAVFGSAPAAIPGTVEVENYDTGGQGVGYSVGSVNGSANSYRADGVDLEATSASGGGYNLGWTGSGQWFRYTVNVATAGTYTVSFEVAAPGAVTGAFHLSNAAGANLSGAINLAATGGWQTWQTVTATVTLPAGQQVLTLNEDNGGWNINKATFALVSAGGPYGGTPVAIPGTVEVENYDTGGQGVGYNVGSINGSANSYRADGVDLEAASGGGYNLGWSSSGQWFRYTVNVATAGTYTVSFGVAAPAAVTGAFHLSDAVGANLSGAVNVPATGGWQTWQTVTATVTLPAGQQVLTLNEDKGGWNINKATFALAQSNSINVLTYGAVGDGVTDNQTALQNAFNAAQAQGKSVSIPAGVFNHSGVLSANGITVQGSGFSTVLRATNPSQSAIELQGNAPAISNLKTEVVAPNRSSQPQAAAIWILSAPGASVKNLVVQGASSNGIRLDRTTNATVSNNLVLGTNADGIAATNGASYNTITNNVVYQSADDAYSDDSYPGEPQDVGNVFTGNIAYHIPYGRGFAAVGSTGGAFSGNTTNGTTWVGIYAQSDSNTQVTSNYTLQNNFVLNANTTVASNYTVFNGDPVGGWIINGSGMVVSNNQTTGTMPSLSSVLGWDPTPYLVDRYSFNPTYVPGTGPGSGN